jgi:gas vesicle protein
MVEQLNIENVLVNGSVVGLFVGLTLWQFKKWMKEREVAEGKLTDKIDTLEIAHQKSIAAVAQVARDTASSVAQVARDTASSVAQVSKENRDENVRLTTDIQQGIRDNREEYIRTGNEIKNSIDKLAEHVATTNGRIGAQEIKIAEQAIICKLIQEGKKEKRGKGK